MTTAQTESSANFSENSRNEEGAEVNKISSSSRRVSSATERFPQVDKKLIEEVRNKVINEIYPSEPQLFDLRDIERLKKYDWAVARFLLQSYLKSDVALQRLVEALKWRKS